MGLDQPAVVEGPRLGREGDLVEGQVLPGRELVAHVEVAVVGQAEGAEQVVRLVRGRLGAVGGAHGDARGGRSEGDQRDDRHRRAQRRRPPHENARSRRTTSSQVSTPDRATSTRAARLASAQNASSAALHTRVASVG